MYHKKAIVIIVIILVQTQITKVAEIFLAGFAGKLSKKEVQ
jgi:hypothetical protein